MTYPTDGLSWTGLNQLPKWQPVPITALVCGDSITAYYDTGLTLTAPYCVDNRDGTATFYRTSHSLTPGEEFRISGAPEQKFNLMDGVVTQVVSANAFRAKLTGRTTMGTSTTGATMYAPRRRSSRGWLSWVEERMGALFDSTWCATGGAVIAEITDLVTNTELLDAYDYGFVMLGMNDVYEGRTYAQIVADYTELLAKMRQKCRRMVILSISCRNSADANWSAARQAIHIQVNRWLYEYARVNNCIFVDTWRAVANGVTYVDSSATNPDMNAVMAIDNTHPSAVGAKAIGDAEYSAISSDLKVGAWIGAHNEQISTNAGNIFTDSNFATESGGVATSWASSDSTANMNVTPTVAARTVSANGDALGYNQIITLNYGTATGTASTRFRRNNFHASLVAGQQFQVSIPYSLSGAVGLLGVSLELIMSDGTYTYLVYGSSLDSNVDVMTDSRSGVLMTRPITIPSGITDADVWVRIYISSAQSVGNDLVVKMWQPVARMWAE